MGSRGVQLRDNATVPGTLAVTRTVNTGALTASSLSTPALTVAGTRLYPQVNADFSATSGLAQILNKPTKLTQFTNDLAGSSAGRSVPGSLTVAGISQVGGFTVTAGGGQQVIVRNTATDTSGLADVFFDRTAALSTAQAAVGHSARGAYLWVNGSDRLNISTAGNVTVPGTVSTGALTPSTLSVTGASTLGGGATVSGNNLIVNTAIGIETVGPSSALHVVGGGQITGTLVVAGLTTAIAGINILSNNTRFVFELNL